MNAKKNKIKNFVLDTNVLLHNPASIVGFGDNHVIIPMVVLEELDLIKTQASEIGRNARQVIRHLDQFRSKGFLGEACPPSKAG